jgi:hypothetical protein
MRELVGRTVLTAMAAAMAIGLGATTSLAASTTWTVSPGGSITGSAGKTTLADTTSGLTVTCTSSALTGSLKTGTGLTSPLGKITSINFNNCSAAGQTVSISTGTVAWPLKAGSYNTTSGVTTGTISRIHFAVSSSVCSFVVDGTGATANNGKVKIKYANGTHKLKILATGGNLHVYNVSGCFGVIASGDAVTITSAYLVSPAQTITSP